MRERFLVLDGLRGIAALAVFWVHLKPPFGPLTQAGIAVDFFFLLSGFVLAHAYEERLGEPGGIAGFIRDRVIRLHPLLVLSLVPAALILSLRSGPMRDPLPLLTFTASAIPFPALWMHRFPAIAFPYNPPSWSLFWELVTNLPFALLAPRLSTRVLLAAATALIAARFGAIAWFGPPGEFDLTAAFRAFPFFTLGVLTHRLHRAKALPLPACMGALAAPILIATLLTPSLPFGSILFPLLCFVAFPLIIAGGAAREARFPRLCAFLGGMSYPLYILHIPLMALTRRLLAGLALPGPIVSLIEASLILFAVWLAWRFYDEPVRAWLRRRFGSRGHRAAKA